MRNEVYWVDGPWSGRLAITARPRGGDWLMDEVVSWKQAGFDVIVSLLVPQEAEELELTQEAALCQNAGIRFFSFPIEDRNVPSSQKMMLEFATNLIALLLEGQSVGIHCRQGIGRSALIVSCLLVLMGISPEVALQRTATARGCAVPDTEEQRRWIFDFAPYAETASEVMPHGQVAAK
jgi:protein tyrosine/serine phosphatase